MEWQRRESLRDNRTAPVMNLAILPITSFTILDKGSPSRSHSLPISSAPTLAHNFTQKILILLGLIMYQWSLVLGAGTEQVTLSCNTAKEAAVTLEIPRQRYRRANSTPLTISYQSEVDETRKRKHHHHPPPVGSSTRVAAAQQSKRARASKH